MRAMTPSDCFRWRGSTLIFDVRVQPRAATSAIGDVENGRLRVRVSAAPVDNAANEMLTAMLAKAFGVAKSQVRVLAGGHARDKRVAIEAPRRLPDWVPPPA